MSRRAGGHGWLVRVNFDGWSHHVGTYEDEEEAARHFDESVVSGERQPVVGPASLQQWSALTMMVGWFSWLRGSLLLLLVATQ